MKKRLYKLDENYFEKIDTEEKAYWLGFIYADGFITKRKQGQNILGITLHEIEPLEKFTKAISTNKPIRSYISNSKYKKNSVEYKTAIVSNKVVQDLESHGVVERKTFTLKFPKLPENLTSHFIRGYFDGDGSVFECKSYRKTLVHLGITICGTESFLKDLRDSIPFLKGVSCIFKDTRKLTDCWSIKLKANKRCLAMYTYMYQDCEENYLSRKKIKFEKFVNDKVQRL